jgi:oxidase EvaA
LADLTFPVWLAVATTSSLACALAGRHSAHTELHSVHEPHLTPPERFETWRLKQLADAGFGCRPIPFSLSREWTFVDGRWRHVSAGFFSVIGLRTEANDTRLDGLEQVILDQRTPAIIGLAVSVQPTGVWSLLQGRIEPSNEGGLQLAPTVQSTKANYTRVHGGRATSYLEPFLNAQIPALYDGMQSEEGSRYLSKYNRTVVKAVDMNPRDPLEKGFCFIDRDGLRSLIARDHCINTDARSVLACADWDLLARPRRAFEDGTEAGAMLRRSFECRWKQVSFREISETLAHWRTRANVHHQILPLDALACWQM